MFMNDNMNKDTVWVFINELELEGNLTGSTISNTGETGGINAPTNQIKNTPCIIISKNNLILSSKQAVSYKMFCQAFFVISKTFVLLSVDNPSNYFIIRPFLLPSF